MGAQAFCTEHKILTRYIYIGELLYFAYWFISWGVFMIKDEWCSAQGGAFIESCFKTAWCLHVRQYQRIDVEFPALYVWTHLLWILAVHNSCIIPSHNWIMILLVSLATPWLPSINLLSDNLHNFHVICKDSVKTENHHEVGFCRDHQ